MMWEVIRGFLVRKEGDGGGSYCGGGNVSGRDGFKKGNLSCTHCTGQGEESRES